jgi:hypothetical protein
MTVRSMAVVSELELFLSVSGYAVHGDGHLPHAVQIFRLPLGRRSVPIVWPMLEALSGGLRTRFNELWCRGKRTRSPRPGIDEESGGGDSRIPVPIRTRFQREGAVAEQRLHDQGDCPERRVLPAAAFVGK